MSAKFHVASYELLMLISVKFPLRSSQTIFARFAVEFGEICHFAPSFMIIPGNSE